MKRFALSALTVPVLAILVLAGCADQAPGETAPHAPESSLAPGGDGESAALGLVNLWRVSGASGESDRTWLRLEANEFQLWRDCGMITGSWQANDTLFLGGAWGGMGDCPMEGMPRVEWIEAAVGFVATGLGYDLLDRDGGVVASLSIDGAPEAIPTAAEFYTQPPEITAELRALFAAAPVLPAGLTPVPREQLEATWLPVGATGTTEPQVTFSADSSWSGSDGCNGAQGRWAAGDDGQFLATSGPQTLMFCEGAPVPFWVSAAKVAGLNEAGELVLIDAEGAELGRLTH